MALVNRLLECLVEVEDVCGENGEAGEENQPVGSVQIATSRERVVKLVEIWANPQHMYIVPV